MTALTLHELMARFPRSGHLEWIGVRPARRAPLEVLEAAEVNAGGLVGDRYAGRSGKRAITLIQAEHLPVIAALAGVASVDPGLLRRNLVVSGINLYALRKSRFRIGAVLLEGTGVCDPCSHMEEALGEGGYNAMRGHGGITARVLEPGAIALGNAVAAVASEEV
ncbi:MOSC domain-containing protein [Spiribacter sp. C176]|uniref:MOSC domain-containing protein n=1 Tax=Spiribacter salilacus TaxID=2664894 RepID=A0A6N7QSI6_9GAMM|nr:MOSC domain-containing protein [Spiribacter salilacus]MRH78952.1 MOSC domain-containing protein [Spiribacter salilacus]